MTIKEIRQRLFMTQEQFAKAVGVCPNSVKRWEMGGNNKRQPSISNLAKIKSLCKENDVKFEWSF